MCGSSSSSSLSLSLSLAYVLIAFSSSLSLLPLPFGGAGPGHTERAPVRRDGDPASSFSLHTHRQRRACKGEKKELHIGPSDREMQTEQQTKRQKDRVDCVGVRRVVVN